MKRIPENCAETARLEWSNEENENIQCGIRVHVSVYLDESVTEFHKLPKKSIDDESMIHTD